jgi:hypothetical protein
MEFHRENGAASGQGAKKLFETVPEKRRENEIEGLLLR